MVSHHNPIGAIALPTLLMVCSFPAFAQSDGPEGLWSRHVRRLRRHRRK